MFEAFYPYYVVIRPLSFYVTQTREVMSCGARKEQIASFFNGLDGSMEPEANNDISCIVPGTNDAYKTSGTTRINKNGRVKRPMNAFMVWARMHRSTIAAYVPKQANSKISMMLGEVRIIYDNYLCSISLKYMKIWMNWLKHFFVH